MSAYGYTRYRDHEGVRVLEIQGWPGDTSRRALSDDLRANRARSSRGRERFGDQTEVSSLYRSLLDVDASYRALLRFEIEGGEDARDLALIQAEENIVSGLTLDTISPELLLAARAKHRKRVTGLGMTKPPTPQHRREARPATQPSPDGPTLAHGSRVVSANSWPDVGATLPMV